MDTPVLHLGAWSPTEAPDPRLSEARLDIFVLQDEGVVTTLVDCFLLTAQAAAGQERQ